MTRSRKCDFCDNNLVLLYCGNAYCQSCYDDLKEKDGDGK